MNAGNYFKHNGQLNRAIEEYFDVDNDGNMEPEIAEYVNQNYAEFPVNSDLVAMYFAEKYASETKGNYSAYTLFTRAR